MVSSFITLHLYSPSTHCPGRNKESATQKDIHVRLIFVASTYSAVVGCIARRPSSRLFVSRIILPENFDIDTRRYTMTQGRPIMVPKAPTGPPNSYEKPDLAISQDLEPGEPS